MNHPNGFGLCLCAAVFATGAAEAAVVGPRLEQHLATDRHEPVPIIITLRGRVDTSTLSGADPGDRRRRIIETLRNRATERQASLGALLEQAGATETHSLWIANAVSASVPPALIPLLASRPDVARIRLDVELQLAEPGSGEPTPAEWNLHAIRAPELWAEGYTGAGVVVGAMDTGVDHLHPDLAERWRGGRNSWFDPAGVYRYPHDTHGHGTQTLSIAVGGSADGSAIGVAPDAQWIAAKIFDDSGYASLSAIHRAFQWMLDPDGDPAVDDTPDVVLNAWSVVDPLEPCNREFEYDIRVLRDAGVAVTFAAGNYGPDEGTSVSPGNLAGSLPTGAVDTAATVAWFSSRGPSACDGSTYPALSAPGLGIKAADLTFGGLLPDSYVYASGTSYSVSHTAGALALLRGAAPAAELAALELALLGSAVDLGEPGVDNHYGAGLIDLAGARQLLPVATPPDPDDTGEEAPSTEPSEPDGEEESPPDTEEPEEPGDDGSAGSIEVTSVVYSLLRELLAVTATSALGESAALVLEGYGPMNWDTRRNEWRIAVRGVTQPPESVTISGVEGSVTQAVP